MVLMLEILRLYHEKNKLEPLFRGLRGRGAFLRKIRGDGFSSVAHFYSALSFLSRYTSTGVVVRLTRVKASSLITLRIFGF